MGLAKTDMQTNEINLWSVLLLYWYQGHFSEIKYSSSSGILENSTYAWRMSRIGKSWSFLLRDLLYHAGLGSGNLKLYYKRPGSY